MTRNTRRVRALLLACAAVLIAAAALAVHATGALRRLELATVDARFDVRGPEPPPDDVLVVAIDADTFDRLGARWPFPRRLHARAIRGLARARPAAIAYDVQFTEASEDPDGDNALIEAVRAAGNVVLATTEVGPGGSTRVFGGGEGLAYSRGTAANANYRKDTDGVLRRVATRLQGLETMPVAAARTARRGRAPAQPPDGGDEAWIDYAGPPGTVRTISFADAVRGTFDPDVVRGRVVVVGATAPSLQDLHPTPTTSRRDMAGAEVQASAASTVLAGYPLRSAPGWVDVLLVLLLAVLAPLVALRAGVVAGLAAGAAALVALAAGAQAAFAGSEVIVAVAVPLSAGTAALLVTGAIQAVTVAFERARVRDAFTRFVPEAVVDDVLRSADGLRLGGVRRECTVMFSDLRGFTSFSEALDPEVVITTLNRYLSEMTGAILAEGGTLVSYMGDGIMALFGAPLDQPDHADRALAAAREMLDRLEPFNAWLRDQGIHDGFRMGIGLNSGPVMAGNVGSEQRLEYTALGDTTNVAARLEGLTKGTPHQLFVAESTRAALTRDPGDLAEAGEVAVRGRRGTVRVWAPGPGA